MKVLYVLKRYPRLSETFIVRELIGIEDAGVVVGIDSLLAPEDGIRHEEVARVRASVRYIARRPRATEPSIAAAHGRVFARSPKRWLHEFRFARSAAGPRSADVGHRRETWRRFLQAGMVADRILREGFDHVHAHFATAATDVAVPAARMAGVPVSVTAHAKDIFHTDNAGRLRERLARVDVIVTVSEFNVDHLRALHCCRSIAHVPNGVALAPACGPTVGGPILCVSRLVEKKGIDTLIEAIALLSYERPGLRLEIIGDGPLRDGLRDQAVNRGVADRVTFLGPQSSSAVDAAYRRCSMVVLPCRITADGDRDGLPTVLVEAMARALPVISTSVVGIPELVRHGETGLLVDPDDPMALASAIGKLIDNPDATSDLGSRGRELVSRSYDPTRSAQKLIEAWGARR